jgi:hypothetical protein
MVILTIAVEELGKENLSQMAFSPLQISHSLAGMEKFQLVPRSKQFSNSGISL